MLFLAGRSLHRDRRGSRRSGRAGTENSELAAGLELSGKYGSAASWNHGATSNFVKFWIISWIYAVITVLWAWISFQAIRENIGPKPDKCLADRTDAAHSSVGSLYHLRWALIQVIRVVWYFGFAGHYCPDLGSHRLCHGAAGATFGYEA